MEAPARDEALRQSLPPGALHVAHVLTEQPRDIVGDARGLGLHKAPRPKQFNAGLPVGGSCASRSSHCLP
jgi:hypothetical protein